MEDHGNKKQCVSDIEMAELTTLPGTSASAQDNCGSVADGERDLKNALITTAMMLLESSSSVSEDDEECIIRHILRSEDDIYPKAMSFLMERRRRNSIKQYVERTVPNYSEEEFRTNFRISTGLFENLCGRLAECNLYKKMRCDKKLTENVNMLVFLWFAGHEACSYRDLSDRFDLSLFTVGSIIERVTMFLSSLSPDVIKWPNDEKKEESANFFGKKCLFQKAIGCIDGTHVVIDPPTSGKDEYIDRKGNTSICVQGICDPNKKCINGLVGFPGSCHDSWVLKNSPIYDKLPSYCGDYYLLGDSAYPCNKYLLTPYKDNGHLKRSQTNFNIKLSSGRVCIEHSFGILKQRCRQLYYCKLRGIKKICHFIRACCVLHNIANEDDLVFTDDERQTSEDFANNENVSRGNNVRDPIAEFIANHMAENN